MDRRYGLMRQAQEWAQAVAQGALVLLAAVLLAATLAAAFGQLPWPDLPLTIAGTPVPDAGMWAQVALTAVMVLLCAYLPANMRMSRLERSHRNFQIGMEDIARAYRIAHAADRAGVFALSGEFENIRARMQALRNHPELRALEPEILETAAVMSYETRQLAQAYSDEKVARARAFLTARQEDVDALTDRIATARRLSDDLLRWKTDVDAEEGQARLQIKRLIADLQEIMPGLGYAIEDRSDKIVALPKPKP
jgi:membrane protein implicated in regulation of membrane protease activity